jgi:hypothetical protein
VRGFEQNNTANPKDCKRQRTQREQSSHPDSHPLIQNAVFLQAAGAFELPVSPTPTLLEDDNHKAESNGSEIIS